MYRLTMRLQRMVNKSLGPVLQSPVNATFAYMASPMEL